MNKNPQFDEASPGRRRRNVALPNEAASDAQLIELVRAGGTSAYGELYKRHVSAATSVARKHVDNSSDADDVVSEAFAAVFASLLAGKGPESFFRAYLLSTVSRISHQKNRASGKTQLTDDLMVLDQEFFDVDAALQSFEAKTIVTAFKTLPERWQAALWYADIEGMKPATSAPLLGLSPNAVSSLVSRAREGLSQNYLQNHITYTQDPSCAQYTGQLGAFIRNGLNRSAAQRVKAHLDICEGCTVVLGDLADIQSRLRADIFPLIAGVAFQLPVASGHGTAAISASRRHTPIRQYQSWLSAHFTAAVCTAAAIAVVGSAAVATQGFGAWADSASRETHLAASGSTPAPSETPARSTPASGNTKAPSQTPTTTSHELLSPLVPATAVPSKELASAPPVPATVAPLSSPSPSSVAPTLSPGSSPAGSPSPDSFPAKPTTRGLPTQTPLVVGVGSGRCLTATVPSGTQLTITDCSIGKGSQHWAYDTASQELSITVAGTTYCLDAEGSGSGNGTGIIAWTCTGQPNQRWSRDPAAQTLVGVPSGRCLSIQGAATTSDSHLELWDCADNSTYQQWRITTPSN